MSLQGWEVYWSQAQIAFSLRWSGHPESAANQKGFERSYQKRSYLRSASSLASLSSSSWCSFCVHVVFSSQDSRSRDMFCYNGNGSHGVLPCDPFRESVQLCGCRSRSGTMKASRPARLACNVHTPRVNISIVSQSNQCSYQQPQSQAPRRHSMWRPIWQLWHRARIAITTRLILVIMALHLLPWQSTPC
jgi:hypothetical protein